MESELRFIEYEKKTIDPRKNFFRNIMLFLKGYRLKYFLSILSQCLSVLFDSLLYVALAWFVDDWLMNESGDRVPLWQAALLIFSISALHAVFSYFSNRLMNETAESVARRLKNCLFDHIQYLSFTRHSNMDAGDLLVRASSDIDAVRRLFSEQIFGICRVIFYFSINLIFILRINHRLGYFTLIIVPFIIISSTIFFKKIAVCYEKYQEEDSRVTSILEENLKGIRVVKAFSRQDYEIDKFNKAEDDMYSTGQHQFLIESLFWPLSDLLCWGQLALSLFFGARYALNGTITPGQFIAFESLITMIVWPLRNLGRQIIHMSRSFISFKRIQEILLMPPEPMEEGLKDISDFRGAISFEHVGFSYGDKPALKDITFDIKVGQTAAVIGSTGCGKTSLINLLPRFYDYTQGSVKLDGYELKDISRDFLRTHIGIVEQEPFLFSATIEDNITFGLADKPEHEAVVRAAKAADIHETILGFEKGYDTVIGERGVTLSGGQKQRIAIARALLMDPPILILDDSLTAVDTETEAAIQNALHTLMQGRTTIIISHRTTSLESADLILVMKDGEIVQSGTHAELLAVPGMYRDIHTIQTRIESDDESEAVHE